jgi:hypothetical protein
LLALDRTGRASTAAKRQPETRAGAAGAEEGEGGSATGEQLPVSSNLVWLGLLLLALLWILRRWLRGSEASDSSS